MEIDPIILELRVDASKFKRDLNNATRTVETQLGKQERSAQRLEKQMLRSSSSISTVFRGLAGTLATVFTGRELVGLVDSFTRLQNSLKVAGLEGESLANVQERLRGIGSQYGVEVEALAGVFNKASLAQKELGASSEQILQLNEAIAASLKITGTSSEEASGALLQLGQALGSGVVRAEEFNSILEGALPLAQAAARGIEGMGGSVAKLRSEVVEGNITSKQFFEGILRAAPDTLKQAESATLTLSGAFTVLRNELTLYVGDASKTSGVTVTLSAAIKGLADNLNVIIPALTVIATALGVGLVTNAVRARIAMIATAAAAQGMAGAFGTATVAAQRLGRMLGGTVGIALTALVIGLGAASSASARLNDELQKAQNSLDATKARAQAAGVQVEKTGKAAKSAGGFFGSLATFLDITSNAYAKLAANAKLAAIAVAQERLVEGRQRAERLQAATTGLSAGLAATADAVDPFRRGTQGKQQELLKARLATEQAIIRKTEQEIEILKRTPGSAFKADPVSSSGGASPKSDSKKTPKGSKAENDRTDQIQARFNDELASLAQQTLSAQQQLATSAEERAELELRSIELARVNTIAGINAEKDYTDVQKQRLTQQVEALTEFEREAVEREKQTQLAREASDTAKNKAQLEIDGLRDQLDLAKTQQDRRTIALRIVDAYYDSERAAIQSALLETKIGDANYQILQARLAALDAARNADQERALDDTATPLEAYLKEIPKGAAAIGESLERDAVSAIKDLNSGLADAIVNGENLGDVLENTGKRFIAQLIEMGIQLLFIKPLLEGLGGGGGLFGTLGSIFAGASPKASGGPVSAGEVYRINESGQEYFAPNTDGKIIPANQVNAMNQGQGAGQADGRITITLSEDLDARVTSIAGPIAVEVVKVATPQITNAAVSETFRRSSRPRI
ncbi:tape measure protein [uncultured Parasphingorhabdus sp.]|uniref:tape measure protein n=1 Tax=uncultured Parasphingorhabdus sp. TaxID=2709694 RepID=UPI002AA6D16C|nr:tape measure protein [uncultured Parasphingorhabdus sp.]